MSSTTKFKASFLSILLICFFSIGCGGGGNSSSESNNNSDEQNRNNSCRSERLIEIKNQEQLDAMRNCRNGNYILLNDIALDENKAGFAANGSGWNPIGDVVRTDVNSYTLYPFTGTLNGNGHKITNLWIDRADSNFIGLFSNICGVVISNLSVEITNGKQINGNRSVGGIAGEINCDSTTITDTHVIGNISGESWVGGIAGSMTDTVITNSRFEGDVNGFDSVGGIAGRLLVSNITNSYAAGNINGTQEIGGIAGIVSHSIVTNSYFVGDVNGYSFVGGIAGNAHGSNVTNNYAAGNVSGDNFVGGIAGTAFSVEGSTMVLINNAAINSYVTGNYYTSYINRIIGEGTAVISNNFALEDMNGNFDTSNLTYYGINKTANQLKQESTYSDAVVDGGLGWRFGNNVSAPWKISNGYPYLYWQD
jgi:hypothetical protein